MKKIICITLCVLSTFSLTSYATDFTTEYSTENNDSISVHGNAQNKKVTLVLKQGDKVCDVRTADSDYNLGFEFQITPPENGDFSIFVTAEGEAASTEKKISYFNSEDRDRIIDIMNNGNEQSLINLFQNEDAIKYYKLDCQDLQNKGLIGKAVYNIRENLDDKDKLESYVSLACLMAKLYEKKSLDSFMELLDEFNSYDVVITNRTYFEGLDQKLKGKIAERMSTQQINLKNFNNTFTDTVVLTGIKESSSWVSVPEFINLVDIKVFTDANSDMKDKICRYIVGKNYNSIEDLKKDINLYISNQNKKPASSGGSGSGGSSSGSSGASSGGAIGRTPVITGEKNPVIADSGEQEKITFEDVRENHWAFEAITFLRWNGFVSGYNNKFEPDKSITRAEAIQCLCNMFGIKDGKESQFSDVSQDSWYYNAVCSADKNGLISGDGANFYPNENITRQDLATILYRFAKYKNYNLKDGKKEFSDSNAISDYALDAVTILGYNGIINGMENDNFLPFKNATKAETAKLLYCMSALK